MLTITSCSTTPTLETKVEPKVEAKVATLVEPQIEAEVVSKVEASIPTEETFILGNWSGTMILGSKDKNGNWEYHGFEYYRFYDNNTLKYSMKVEQYGIVTSDYTHTYEWKYENGVYYKRLHNNRYNNWVAFNVVYVNNDRIIIDNINLNRL